MEVGISEMLMIALAIVVLFGPDKLPQIARDLGSGVRKMKGAVEDIKTEIMKELTNFSCFHIYLVFRKAFNTILKNQNEKHQISTLKTKNQLFSKNIDQ